MELAEAYPRISAQISESVNSENNHQTFNDMRVFLEVALALSGYEAY